MALYNLKTTRDENGVYHSTNNVEEIKLDNRPEKTLLNPGEGLLASLGACKAMGFYDLAKKHNMDIKYCEVEINAETGRGAISPETNRPVSTLLSIEFIYKIDSENTDEELENYLHYVNGACTVSNSLNKDIKQSYKCKRISR